MKRLTMRNGYGEAILVDASRSDSFANAIEKLCRYEEIGEVNDYISEFKYLLRLDDEQLADEIFENSNVQNALSIFIDLVKKIKEIQNT